MFQHPLRGTCVHVGVVFKLLLQLYFTIMLSRTQLYLGMAKHANTKLAPLCCTPTFLFNLSKYFEMGV